MTIDVGVPGVSELPGAKLAGLARRTLTTEPEREVLEFEGRWITRGELRVVADRVAELVDACTDDPLAPVAFAPQNRPSAIAALSGLVAMRRNIRMMYAYQSPEAMARNLERVKASILVADQSDCSSELAKHLEGSGCAVIALKDGGAEFMRGFEKVTRGTDPDRPDVPTFEMLTSGTTGGAKLWPLTYEVLEDRFVSGNSAFGGKALAQAPPTLLCYPLGNISGLYTAVPAMVSGMRMLLQKKFTLEGWLEWVRRFRPDPLYLPPVGIQMVLDADVPKQDLSYATFCRSGMTKVPVEVERAFEEKYGIPILMSYGATEFGGVVVQMELEDSRKWGDAKIGSTGREYGSAKVRVVDPATGEEVATNQEGLLEVLVPSITGWTRTSDIARIDEDGFVFILGRADGAIMRGGFKVLPETVEAALIQHPDIEDAAVVGVDDSRLGQVPAALIVMKSGRAQLSEEALEQHVRRHVPATHVPALWSFAETMPRTPSLKISRSAVKDLVLGSPPN